MANLVIMLHEGATEDIKKKFPTEHTYWYPEGYDEPQQKVDHAHRLFKKWRDGKGITIVTTDEYIVRAIENDVISLQNIDEDEVIHDNNTIQVYERHGGDVIHLGSGYALSGADGFGGLDWDYFDVATDKLNDDYYKLIEARDNKRDTDE
jgi:hypothetical protein